MALFFYETTLMTSFRRLIVVLLMALSVFTFIRTSLAQSPRPSSGSRGLGVVNRPAYSPYLNLLRTNTGPVQNYYGLVRPQQQFQANDELFDSNFQTLRKEAQSVRQETDQSSKLSQSGHAARFMTDLRGGFGSNLHARSEDSKSGQEKFNASRLGPSGHAVSFGNTGSYFPTRGR